MGFHGLREFRRIAPFAPGLEEGELLFRTKGFKTRIVFEKTLERRHEMRAPGLLDKNKSELVVSHAEFFEALVHLGIVPVRETKHAAVNLGPLFTGTSQCFPPCREGQDRLRTEPGNSLLERN